MGGGEGFWVVGALGWRRGHSGGDEGVQAATRAFRWGEGIWEALGWSLGRSGGDEGIQAVTRVFRR